MKTEYKTDDLIFLKNKIENMDKMHHLEILKIIKKFQNVKINENKNGIFLNLSCLSIEILNEISTYVSYILEQEKSIQQIEIQQEDCKNYIIEKKNKDKNSFIL